MAHQRLRARGERTLVVGERAPVASAQAVAHRFRFPDEQGTRIIRYPGPLQDRLDHATHHRAGRYGAGP